MRIFKPEHVPKPQGVADFSMSQVPQGLALDIEIGCGVGLHPIRYVQQNPDRYLVAIEQTRIKFEKFAGRLSHHEKMDRLWPVHADAIEWITHFLVPSSVDRFFILYPNPKPKNESQRWYAMPFMERLRDTLKPGGEIILATNEEYYVRGARRYMKDVWKFLIVKDSPVDFRPRTHFEKKYLARGEVCWDLVFKKS